MLINIGRLLMLCVWGFLILNLVHPFPRPLNIFVNVALIFTVLTLLIVAFKMHFIITHYWDDKLIGYF